jgi:protein-S-isoprenylcysteine O-methyltransferase Ste14
MELGKKIMPTNYFIAFLALSIALHFLFPIKKVVYPPYTYAGFIMILFGAIMNLWTDRLFKEKNTTVKPYLEPTSLITSGPFSLSRHPMYLGMASVLLGVAVNHGTIITFVFPLLFVILMEILFIPFEEETLIRIYGVDYRDYQSKVRRWV